MPTEQALIHLPAVQILPFALICALHVPLSVSGVMKPRLLPPLEWLMTDALILACIDDFDVFNALDIFENMEFLKV